MPEGQCPDFFCPDPGSLLQMRKSPLHLVALAAALAGAVSCASIGNPSGGPRDEDPPRFVSSTPAPGSVEVSPQKVVLTFDELVTLKDPFSKVVVSPPQAQAPRVSSLGRRVTVEFRDTLLPSTTYTVDFGDAIADNNEGNVLPGFLYSFSTGPVLDSLMVSGMVLGAADLAPAAGMYVGLHSNLADSAFTRTRFDRVAKTDDEGRFVIGGLAPGRYRIYALDDRDGDLAWSSPDESLAFYDAVIEPFAEPAVAVDTVFNLLTGEVDTVMERRRTRFLPNNILLRSYNTGFAQQYITKYERVDSTRLDFFFNTPSDSAPTFRAVLPSGGVPLEEVSVVERSPGSDSLTFWLTAPEIVARDTLMVAVRYFRADSAYNMVPVADTLRMLTQRPVVRQKKGDRKGAADTVPLPPPVMALKALSGKVEIDSPVFIEAPVPLESFDRSMVRLELKEDSLWLPVEAFGPGNVAADSLRPRLLRVDFPWEYAATYRLTVDSLAGRSIYGVVTDDMKLEFKIRPESEYGSLRFNLRAMGPDSVPRFVQLLDEQGRPVRTEPLRDGSVTFLHLLPGKYNARVIEDADGNLRWDPGNFVLGLQPDLAYYYRETVELKANWDQEIDWDVFAVPVDRMVPESLRPRKSNSRR